MATVYRIRDWKEHFEVSQSIRNRGPLRWVGLPTKHDGKGFRRLIQLPNGPALFGCWCLIVQIAAKADPRGVLSDSEGPLSAEDMEYKTGCPAGLFLETIEVLCSQPIAWLEEVDFSESRSALRADSEHPPPTVPNRTDRTDSTEPLPAPVLGAGNFEIQKNGTGDGPQTPAWLRKILDRVKPVHLPKDGLMFDLHLAITKAKPGYLAEGDLGLLQIFGASERAIQIGKRPVALFVSIVRDKRWDLISEQQGAMALKRLQEYRERKT